MTADGTMRLFVEMAWNNLRRNRRRSLSLLAAIGIGVSMIVLTNGLTGGIAANISDSLVNQIDGHLRVTHRDYQKFFLTDQEKILIRDYRALAADIIQIAHVRAVMPRVMGAGLLGKGDRSTTFLSFSSDLTTLPTVLPDYGKNLVAGELLSERDPDGVLVGQALAKDLDIKVGDELVLLSKTVHGEESNALVHVRGIVTFPPDRVLEQSLVFTGLGKNLRANLFDLDQDATQLVIRLDDTKNVAKVESELNRLFQTRGLPWRVTPWYDNAVYGRMVGMFGGIGKLISIILVLMVGLITSNALLMAFFERIREIGTLRAIGMRRLDIYRLLYVESTLVGIGGALIGLSAGVMLVLFGARLGIPLGGIVNQEVRPILDVSMLALSVAAPLVSIAVAAMLPIRAVSRLNVIESLNYR